MQCFKEFGKYAFLNMLGMLGLSCYILADTFFVAGGLGAEGLAALNLAIPVYSFLHGSGLMLGMGGATRYSILRNRGKQREGDEAFTRTMGMAVVLAGVFLTFGMFFSGNISALLGAEGNIFQMCRTYLRTLLLFSPAFLMNDAVLCFVRNDGAPQLSMAAMVGGSFSNIILDYIFIFPLHMGIFGAVFATGLAPLISLAILSPYFFKRKNHFHIVKCRVPLREIRYILASGLPSLVAELSSGIVMIIFNVMILNMEGNVGVAAYGVIANLSLVVIALYTGVAQGIQPLLSKYYGMGKTCEIRAVFRYAAVTVCLLSVLIYGLVLFYGNDIVMAFNGEGNQKMQNIAVWGIKLYFAGCLPAGINIIMAVFFTSTDFVNPAGLISVLRGFVLIIPLAFLLSAVWQMTGLWLTFPMTEGLTAVFAFILYSRCAEKLFTQI